MSEPTAPPSPEPRRVPPAVAGARNLVVGALLGGGSIVMLAELAGENRLLAAAAVVAGLAFVFLLSRPLDLRSAVYAFFVPIAMSYGAATGQYALLVAGIGVGVFFLMEKTAAARGRS